MGAKPYHQAYQRGVKLVGAMASPLARKYGATRKDDEKTVLARGLRYHIENRVIVDGSKCIILGYSCQ